MIPDLSICPFYFIMHNKVKCTVFLYFNNYIVLQSLFIRSTFFRIINENVLLLKQLKSDSVTCSLLFVRSTSLSIINENVLLLKQLKSDSVPCSLLLVHSTFLHIIEWTPLFLNTLTPSIEVKYTPKSQTNK